MTRFKVCGMTRAADAAVAADSGAAFGGVILAPGSPRTISVDAATRVYEGSGLIRCGVFVNAPLQEVLEATSAIGLEVLQLHGEEDPEYVAAVAAAARVEVWKAVRPRTGAEFTASVDRYSRVADALLVDGWSAAGRGGTGTRFPWEEVAARRAELPAMVRLIVAGGLTPGNVGEVISLLAPDVVDVSSGVEKSPGVKDERLIRAFAEAVAGAEVLEG